jgi:hypothetical protein
MLTHKAIAFVFDAPWPGLSHKHCVLSSDAGGSAAVPSRDVDMIDANFADIILDRDTAITLGDGTVVYADVVRRRIRRYQYRPPRIV